MRLDGWVVRVSAVTVGDFVTTSDVFGSGTQAPDTQDASSRRPGDRSRTAIGILSVAMTMSLGVTIPPG
jgi:hypothetical protein